MCNPDFAAIRVEHHSVIVLKRSQGVTNAWPVNGKLMRKLLDCWGASATEKGIYDDEVKAGVIEFHGMLQARRS